MIKGIVAKQSKADLYRSHNSDFCNKSQC